MMWLTVLPPWMHPWEKWRLFGTMTMSTCTPSTSCFDQFLATFFYGDVRVGPLDRRFWIFLKYSYTEVVRRILRIKVRRVIDHRINNERVREFFLTYWRFAIKLSFVNSLTSEKSTEEKVPTFPLASLLHGATTLAKWADRFSRTSSVSSEIFNSSYPRSTMMVPWHLGDLMR